MIAAPAAYFKDRMWPSNSAYAWRMAGISGRQAVASAGLISIRAVDQTSATVAVAATTHTRWLK